MPSLRKGLGMRAGMQDVSGRQELVDEIVAIVAAEAMIERDEFDPDTPLSELDIQSADFVMMLLAIEERFGIYMSVDAQLTDARTAGELVAAVAAKVETQRQGAPR